jgi:uncharacterized protein
MQYRRFGQIDDFQVSALGFGCMRLPTLGDPSRIDEPEAIRMIRHAIDGGVNYMDTAYIYHGGHSETVLGRALLDGYRRKVRIATKLPVQKVESRSDFEAILGEQLARLQTEQIDFYLLHGIGLKGWEYARDLGVMEWMEGATRDGRIGHIGFSFHDDFDAFKAIVDGCDGWEFCQIQYNYLDVDLQAGTKGLHYAHSKGLAVSVMEPLLGGRLAAPPTAVQAIWDRAERRRNSADWALQWVWNQPEVSVVLSGMSTMEQVRQNLASADLSRVGSFSAEELQLIAAARKLCGELYPVPCTQCSYCMPCPNGVEIPANMLTFNRGVALDAMASARFQYGFPNRQGKGDGCVQCRECEERCPQGIPIGDWMPYIDEVLAKGIDHDPTRAPSPRCVR